MLNRQKTLEREALLRRLREQNIDIAQLTANMSEVARLRIEKHLRLNSAID
jgi:hypothetical protein